jgi:hypothetical protein
MLFYRSKEGVSVVSESEVLVMFVTLVSEVLVMFVTLVSEGEQRYVFCTGLQNCLCLFI